MQKTKPRPKLRKIKKETPISSKEQKTSPENSLESDGKENVLKPELKVDSEEMNLKQQNLQQQYEALNKKYQFLIAEYSNYKKQQLKQTENFRKYEGQQFIQTLITNVIDSFDLAIKQDLTDQNINEFKKGISMIYESLKKTMENIGVTAKGSKGDLFDPSLHCALGSAPSEKVPPGHVLQVIKKAYLFHDRLIRPAEVIVSEQNTNDEPTTKEENVNQ